MALHPSRMVEEPERQPHVRWTTCHDFEETWIIDVYSCRCSGILDQKLLCPKKKKAFVSQRKVSVSQKSFFVSQKKVFCIPKKVFVSPKKVFCIPKKSFLYPKKSFCIPKKVFCIPKKVFCIQKKAPPSRNVVSQKSILYPKKKWHPIAVSGHALVPSPVRWWPCLLLCMPSAELTGAPLIWQTFAE